VSYRGLILGYGVINVGGGVVLFVLIEWLWKRFYEKRHIPEKKLEDRDSVLTFLVGCVERTLYTLALCFGLWQWIGFWIGIKVAIRWPNKSGSAYGPADNIWLLGTALSLLLGLLAARIVLGHLALNASPK